MRLRGFCRARARRVEAKSAHARFSWLLLATVGCARIGYTLVDVDTDEPSSGGRSTSSNGGVGNLPVGGRSGAANGTAGNPSDGASGAANEGGGSGSTPRADAGSLPNGGATTIGDGGTHSPEAGTEASMTAAGGAPGGSGHAGDAGGATIAAGAVNGGTSGVGGASGAGTTASAGVGGISCAPSEGAVEICDGIDNDCSGVADDGNACSAGCTGDVNAGRSYMYCTTPVFPSAAADACAAENMRLVRVNDSAENAYLVQRITADAWLGGSDAVFEGYWFWPDGELFWIGNQFGTSNGAYANFALGEPNNLSGHPDPEEDCAILRADGLWNDVPCGLTAHSFVCELY